MVRTGGLGYRVHVGPGTRSRLPEEGVDIELWCELVVKEDALELYGFETREARAVFQTARGISGVGPKVALHIAEVGTPGELRQATEQSDTTLFEQIPGVGGKKAKKIVFELSGKLPESDEGHNAEAVDSDALGALTNLGFTKRDARAALAEVKKRGDAGNTEERVKEALSLLGANK